MKMDPKKRQEISKLGGKAVPPEKRSFSKDRALAVEAGRKGGLAVPKAKRAFSADPLLASRAGRKGGSAAAGRPPEKPKKK